MATRRKKPRRIRRRGLGSNLGILGLALVLGLGYIFFGSKPQSSASDARARLSPQEQGFRITNDYQTLSLPVPSTPIAKGQEITADNIRMVDWPSAEVRSEFVQTRADVIGKQASRALLSGVPIPHTGLSDGRYSLNEVAEEIPSGMRAITIRVDQEAAIEGWAQPGNFVDVIVIRAAEKGELRAKVVAENIKILSAGRSTKSDVSAGGSPRVPDTVTLLVSQTNALKIKTAEGFGRLTFAMRAPGDKAPVAIDSVNQRAIVGGEVAGPKSDRGFKGYAKGPDGQTYVLSNSARWLEADPGLVGR